MKLHVAMAAALVCIASTPALAADDGKYAEFDGVKIHYIDRGKGEPIVLLHGGTSSLDSWLRTGVVANLDEVVDFRAFANDRRAQGAAINGDVRAEPGQYAEAVLLHVVRCEVVPGQRVEAVVGRAKDVHRGHSPWSGREEVELAAERREPVAAAAERLRPVAAQSHARARASSMIRAASARFPQPRVSVRFDGSRSL